MSSCFEGKVVIGPQWSKFVAITYCHEQELMWPQARQAEDTRAGGKVPVDGIEIEIEAVVWRSIG
jgi:hypothetical protein